MLVQEGINLPQAKARNPAECKLLKDNGIASDFEAHIVYIIKIITA